MKRLLKLMALLTLSLPAWATGTGPNSFAWSENGGWINFAPNAGPGVTVTSTGLSGMAWSENFGWIDLAPVGIPVANNGAGVLSGYAWGENIGWINFAPTGGGVSISLTTGKFTGYAWSENLGWINFDTVAAVNTVWPATLNAFADTDHDGIPDGVELSGGTNPFTKDNDVFNNSTLFVMQQYRDFLAREGDAGGVAYWTNQVQSGAVTRSQFIQMIIPSGEFQGVIAPVARLYFAFFLRYPDYAGLMYHSGRLRTGTVLSTIADEAAGSPEFLARYGTLTNDQFVELVYVNVLGRPSDPGGKAGWVNYLNAGGTRGQMMVAVSEGVEFVAAIANEVFVTMMYVGMLRREPDAGGFAYWVAAMDAGTSGLDLTNAVVSSPEYHNRFLP